jgi:hypothetical protein
MLLSITILGFIVTFLLLINLRQSNKVNIYLFFFLLINNIYSLSHYATVYSGNKYLIAIMLVHFAPLYLLLGPLFYFYVRGLLKDDYKLSKLDLLHFIPAIIILINAAPFIFQGSEYKLAYAQSILQDPLNILKIKNLFLSPVVTFMLRPVFALGYVIATIILIYRNELHETYTSKQSKLIYKWLTLLIVMSILLYLGFLVFTLFVFKKMDYYSSYDQGVFMLYCTIAGLILLNISLLFFPNILYGLPQLDFAIVTKNNIAVEQQLGIAEDIKKQGKGFEISQESQALQQILTSFNPVNATFNSGVGRISSWTFGTTWLVSMNLANFKVYNRELTQQEIENNFNANKSKFYAEKDGLSPNTASSSAYQIKQDYPSSTDGFYWIKNANINGGTPFKIYADMTTDGGGWTLILKNSSNSVWTYANAISYNTQIPFTSTADITSTGTVSYSIIGWADYLKKSASGFQYMIDAGSRRSFGGIWTANGSYSFVKTDNTQTDVTINTKFGNWNYNSANNGISQRMPWYSNTTGAGTGFITLASGTGNWWGTLVANNQYYSPSPWLSDASGGTSTNTDPGIIWYWVR